MKPQLAESMTHAKVLLEREGAALINQVEGSADSAKTVMRELLGDRLKALPEPAKVLEGGEKDRKQAGTTHHDALMVHTDGFAYGDLYPDTLVLVCVNASTEGGESFLVDGYEILTSLAGHPDTRWAAAALASIKVDLTEEGMQAALSPIVLKTPQNRLMVRRTLDEHGNGPKVSPASTNPQRDQEMIDIWTQAIETAAVAAPRFHLKPGQALLVDNYRMFHGREGYADPQRMMWRVWGWSDQSLGVPDIPLYSDTRYAHAN
ncbi:MAG: TauD/TfdA family dioxygenase [Pseudomonadota bacterium]